MSRLFEAKQHWSDVLSALRNPKEFVRFLDFSTKIYKYSFSDSALIYQQNPNVTAVADFATWNRYHRRIVQNERSIVVFGNEEQTKCRYLFDIAQTTSRIAPPRWRLDEKLTAKFALATEGIRESSFKGAFARLSSFDTAVSEEEVATLTDIAAYITAKRCEENTNLQLAVVPNFEGMKFLSAENFVKFCSLGFEIAKENLLEIELDLKENRERSNEDGRERLRILRDERAGESAGGEHSVAMGGAGKSDFKTGAEPIRLSENRAENSDGERADLSAGRGNWDVQSRDVTRIERGGGSTAGGGHWALRQEVAGVDANGIPAESRVAESELPLEPDSEGDRQGNRQAGGGTKRAVLPPELPAPDGLSGVSSVGETAANIHTGNNFSGRLSSAGLADGGVTPLSLSRFSDADGEVSPAITRKEKAAVSEIEAAVFAPAGQLSFFGEAAPRERISEVFQRPTDAPATQMQAVALPESVIGRALTIDCNQRSLQRIVAYSSHGATQAENAAFLAKEYGTGGVGFHQSGVPFSLWYDENGLKIAPGTTAKNAADKLQISWEDAAARVQSLLEDGSYVGRETLDAAPSLELKEMSERLWYLRQEFSDEAIIAGHLPTVSSLYFAFPDSTKRISELLENPEKLSTIIAEMQAFGDAFDSNRDLLRFEQYKPKEMLQELLTFQKEPVSFQSNSDFTAEKGTFITQDEIDAELTNKSAAEKAKNADFFSQNSDSKKRENFLKDLYGTGGGGYTGHHQWHDSNGLKLERGEPVYGTVLLTWNEVAKRIDHLIQHGLYDVQRVPNTQKAAPETIAESQETASETIAELATSAPSQDFRYSLDSVPPIGAKSRFNANIEAIKVLQNCEKNDRFASPSEQAILAKYAGWGGMPQAFAEGNSDQRDAEQSSRFARHQTNYDVLKSLLTPEEYDSARASTLTSFYTPPAVISAVYKALEGLGFESGKILEPSCGVGNFFSLLPKSMEKSRLFGVELDSISGRIAAKLYPSAKILVKGFEKTTISDGSFDVAIGNVPFGTFSVADSHYDSEKLQIHDYFFAKTLDKLRIGGVLAFVTAKGTLDSKDDSFRRYLAQRADLVGAIRLPNSAFKANAGTETTSDIIFLQRRSRATAEAPNWLKLGQTADGIPVNQYFLDNPEMLLGRMAFDERIRERYGDENSTTTTCLPLENALEESLEMAVAALSERLSAAGKIFANSAKTARKTAPANTLPADEKVRNYTHTLVGGDLYFRENDEMKMVTETGKTLQRMKGLHELRVVTLATINAQVDGCSDEELAALQEKLNSVYDRFTKENGLITARENARAFSDDDDYNTLCALEEQSENAQKNARFSSEEKVEKGVKKAQLFFKRTIKPTQIITEVDTPSEALQVSLDTKGAVDIPYMAALCGESADETCAVLLQSGQIFLNPSSDIYEESTAYLSGNVRKKLLFAEEFAKENPALLANVAALQKVLPKLLEAPDIAVRISVPWVDIEDYSAFFRDYAKGHMYTHPLRRTRAGEYKIANKGEDKSIAATENYGTERMNSYTIFEALLNNRDTIVRDRQIDINGNTVYLINQKDTQLATEKARQMKEAFKKWLWGNSDRREKYVTRYNNLFNAVRGRDYDGAHQTFPGMSLGIALRPHQLSAIARVKYGGNTLLAHCVGAGKSFEMIAATMEKRRLGLVNKACVVVPKHLTLQTASEWGRLYPGAKLLVAAPKDFEKSGRQRFIARCVTGDYDAVIMSFTQFEKITMSPEYRQAFFEKELSEIISAISETDSQDKLSIKDLERQKINLEVRLERLLAKDNKDASLQFEQLGFDSLVVDEAHNYKNCLVVSKMKNVAGVSTTAAQKSEDMLMKCQWLNEKTGYKGLVFATGTPVSNSMVELYTMKRYLRPDLLEAAGLQTFDDWAAEFGEVVSALELKPAGDGFRMKKRFSKFVNIPELMQMYKEFADIQTADMVQLPVPKMLGGKPQIIVANPSDFTRAYMKTLAARSERIHSGSVEPSVDNMLKITHEARLLGLDPRCLNPNAENAPDSKVNKCIDNVCRIYEKTAVQKGVQVIFCDIAIGASDGRWSVYDCIKSELERRGIPSSEVCAAGDATTDERRAKMFAQLRSGEKRVIIASTPKLGTGANVQDRLAALHHLDIPWRPSDLEQRNGRILRQGNSFPEVEILHYTTAETFDTYMLNIITTKQKFISQVMTSKSPARSADDVDELVLTYSEMQAITSGNPLIKEKLELDNDISRLKLLESEHDKSQFKLSDLAEKTLPTEIAKYSELEKKVEKDLADFEKNSRKDFFITIHGKGYDERKAAGAALQKGITQCLITGEASNVGEYAGFVLRLEKSPIHGACSLTLQGETRYYCDVELGNDLGNILRLENLAKDGILSKLEGITASLACAKTELAEALAGVGKAFPQSEELAQKLSRIEVVNASLCLGAEEVLVDENSQSAEVSVEENEDECEM